MVSQDSSVNSLLSGLVQEGLDEGQHLRKDQALYTKGTRKAFAFTTGYVEHSFKKFVPTKHVSTKHVPTKHVSTKHVSTKHVSTKHVSTKHVSTKHVSTKRVRSKHVRSKYMRTRRLRGNLELETAVQTKHVPTKRMRSKDGRSKYMRTRCVRGNLELETVGTKKVGREHTTTDDVRAQDIGAKQQSSPDFRSKLQGSLVLLLVFRRHLMGRITPIPIGSCTKTFPRDSLSTRQKTETAADLGSGDPRDLALEISRF